MSATISGSAGMNRAPLLASKTEAAPGQPATYGRGETPPGHLEFAKHLTKEATPDHRMPVVDKAKVDPEVLKAAQGMEAMFIDYMLKTMRDTVPKNDLDLESPATGIYRSMQDTETAQRAARAGGVGLADQIVAYIEAQRYTVPSPSK